MIDQRFVITSEYANRVHAPPNDADDVYEAFAYAARRTGEGHTNVRVWRYPEMVELDPAIYELPPDTTTDEPIFPNAMGERVRVKSEATTDYKEKYEDLARLVVEWKNNTGTRGALRDAACEIEKELAPVDPRVGTVAAHIKTDCESEPLSYEESARQLPAKLDELA
jgi:hypothetical protein